MAENLSVKRRINLLSRFEEAVRADEFKGGQPEEDRRRIHTAYLKLKEQLIAVLSE